MLLLRLVRRASLGSSPGQIAKEQLLPYIKEFSTFMEAFIAAEETTYDVVHANFFMSGWVGLQRRLPCRW